MNGRKSALEQFLEEYAVSDIDKWEGERNAVNPDKTPCKAKGDWNPVVLIAGLRGGSASFLFPALFETGDIEEAGGFFYVGDHAASKALH